MAEYVPPGREYRRGIASVTGTFSTVDKEVIERCRAGFEKGDPVVFDGDTIFITSMSVDLSHVTPRATLKFEASGALSPMIMAKLSALPGSTLDVDAGLTSFDHMGYIKRDVTETHEFSDTLILRLWDIPVDKDGNAWEVSLLENIPYYCFDCNDMHDDWKELETHLFKNRKKAEKKYAEMMTSPIVAHSPKSQNKDE
jgi:hypothetical protein